MAYYWFKALHHIGIVVWFAGLFYLPRLFVYHAMSEDKISQERFKISQGLSRTRKGQTAIAIDTGNTNSL
jgi:uncharacterized membrane protein